MFLWDFLLALIIALLITSIFKGGFRKTGPGDMVWTFFIIVFLASWVGGLWIRPVGPLIWGIYWLPFLFMSFFFAILLAAAVPAPPLSKRTQAAEETEEEMEQEEETKIVLGIFFWVLILILALAVIGGYLWRVKIPVTEEKQTKEIVQNKAKIKKSSYKKDINKRELF